MMQLLKYVGMKAGKKKQVDRRVLRVLQSVLFVFGCLKIGLETTRRCFVFGMIDPFFILTAADMDPLLVISPILWVHKLLMVFLLKRTIELEIHIHIIINT